MTHVHEPSPGANAADPPVTPHGREEGRAPLPWKPSDATRWAHLSLSDPPENGMLPRDALVPDALAWALVSPEAGDPIEGIVSPNALDGAPELARACDADVVRPGRVRGAKRRGAS